MMFTTDMTITNKLATPRVEQTVRCTDGYIHLSSLGTAMGLSSTAFRAKAMAILGDLVVRHAFPGSNNKARAIAPTNIIQAFEQLIANSKIKGHKISAALVVYGFEIMLMEFKLAMRTGQQPKTITLSKERYEALKQTLANGSSVKSRRNKNKKRKGSPTQPVQPPHQAQRVADESPSTRAHSQSDQHLNRIKAEHARYAAETALHETRMKQRNKFLQLEIEALRLLAEVNEADRKVLESQFCVNSVGLPTFPRLEAAPLPVVEKTAAASIEVVADRVHTELAIQPAPVPAADQSDEETDMEEEIVYEEDLEVEEEEEEPKETDDEYDEDYTLSSSDSTDEDDETDDEDTDDDEAEAKAKAVAKAKAKDKAKAKKKAVDNRESTATDVPNVIKAGAKKRIIGRFQCEDCERTFKQKRYRTRHYFSCEPRKARLRAASLANPPTATSALLTRAMKTRV